MPYHVQADLEVAVGGTAVLNALLDKDRDRIADPAQIAAVMNQAHAEVTSAIQIAVQLDAITAPYPDSLIYNEARIAAYYAWLNAAAGQAMPENIKTAHQDALRWLDQVARGERTLGTAAAPTPTIAAKQIDTNPNHDRVTRESMKGCW